MIDFSQFSTGWQRCFLRLILGLALFWIFTATAAVDTSTNFVPLSELKGKWDSVPLPEVQKAAEAGDAHAMHYLGYCYGEGSRVTRDANQSLAWYQRGLQAGYLMSANNMGMLFLRGQFGSNSLDRAVYYYRYAADRGVNQAQMNLGFLYRDGKGVPQDPVQAMHWFQLAAAGGLGDAMSEIGRLYRFGQGVEKNPDEAKRWLEKAVEKNSAFGKINLGELYLEQQEPEKAIAIFQQAADQGSPDAMDELYQVYWDGNGVPADHKKAMEWLTKAANMGYVRAEYNLGFRYETPEWKGGVFTPPDWPQAFHWYHLAAEHASPEAKHHLGILYLRGKGVEIDEPRGLELVRSAADQGVQAAMHDLAQCYAFGIGEPRNDADRPIELLRRSQTWDELINRYEMGYGTERDVIAAAECYAEATQVLRPWMYTLSDKLEFHPGIRTQSMTGIQSFDDREVQISIPYKDGSDDLRRALSLYLQAAKGNGQAAFQIGNQYLKGQDAPQSNARAWAWFALAAQKGSADAQKNLKELESRIDANDLKKAEQERARQVNQLSRFATKIAN